MAELACSSGGTFSGQCSRLEKATNRRGTPSSPRRSGYPAERTAFRQVRSENSRGPSVYSRLSGPDQSLSQDVQNNGGLFRASQPRHRLCRTPWKLGHRAGVRYVTARSISCKKSLIASGAAQFTERRPCVHVLNCLVLYGDAVKSEASSSIFTVRPYN